MEFIYTIWILLIPFFLFLLIGLTGMYFKPIVSGIVGTIGLGVITLLSFITAYQYFFLDGMVDGVYQKIIAASYTWLAFTDTLHIDMGVMLDPIAVMMLLVVSIVSFMVHIY
ncbi:MAG: NADH-quinone oxidoreductase subunit L, partial [Bacteroidales bacterium]|nr:NADH-quinone oxidoreductase subunit L [Bacteroidales bacterium]